MSLLMCTDFKAFSIIITIIVMWQVWTGGVLWPSLLPGFVVMLYTNLVGPLKLAAAFLLCASGLVPIWKQPIIDNLSLTSCWNSETMCNTLSQPDCVLHQKPVMGSELSRIRITHYYYYYICTSLIGDYNQI